MTDLTALLLGLLGLWLGAELTLRSTIELAERTRLSQSFLGLALLAVGTGLPELVVAVEGGMHQLRGVEASGLVVGNAIGSALTQGSLVLGAAGLYARLHLARRAILRDGLALFASIAALALLAADGRIDRFDGVALLGLYGIYYVLLARQEHAASKLRGARAPRGLGVFLAIAAGLATLVASAEFVVERGIALAADWQMDQTVVGILLLGAGTSVPELVLSFGAAARGRIALSVGNVIGSNLFDLLVPIGISAGLHPLAFDRDTLLLDLPAFAAFTALALFFFWRSASLERSQALLLVGLYAGYALLRLSI